MAPPPPSDLQAVGLPPHSHAGAMSPTLEVSLNKHPDWPTTTTPSGFGFPTTPAGFSLSHSGFDDFGANADDDVGIFVNGTDSMAWGERERDMGDHTHTYLSDAPFGASLGHSASASSSLDDLLVQTSGQTSPLSDRVQTDGHSSLLEPLVQTDGLSFADTHIVVETEPQADGLDSLVPEIVVPEEKTPPQKKKKPQKQTSSSKGKRKKPAAAGGNAQKKQKAKVSSGSSDENEDAVDQGLSPTQCEDEQRLHELQAKAASHQPLTAEEKRLKRILKNRLSAQRSRNKKKAEFHNIHQENADLKAALEEQQRRLAAAEAENERLRSQLSALRSTASATTTALGMPGSPCNISPRFPPALDSELPRILLPGGRSASPALFASLLLGTGVLVMVILGVSMTSSPAGMGAGLTASVMTTAEQSQQQPVAVGIVPVAPSTTLTGGAAGSRGIGRRILALDDGDDDDASVGDEAAAAAVVDESPSGAARNASTPAAPTTAQKKRQREVIILCPYALPMYFPTDTATSPSTSTADDAVAVRPHKLRRVIHSADDADTDTDDDADIFIDHDRDEDDDDEDTEDVVVSFLLPGPALDRLRKLQHRSSDDADDDAETDGPDQWFELLRNVHQTHRSVVKLTAGHASDLDLRIMGGRENPELLAIAGAPQQSGQRNDSAAH